MSFTTAGIDMDEVLFDMRPYPLSLDDWYDFLKSEQAEENLGYWLDTQTYRQVVKKEKGIVKGRQVELRVQNRDDPLLKEPTALARHIIQKWIGPKATVSEVNLSDEMRKELLDSAESQGEDPVDFAPSQFQVREMMGSGDRFSRFVHQKMTQNISKSEGKFRFRFGLFLIVLTTVLGVLLRVFVPVLPRIALAFILLLPFGMGFYFSTSGVTRTCSGRALRQIQMRRGTMWYEARGCMNGCNKFLVNGEACDIRVMDKDVNAALKKRGIVQLVVMTLLIFAFSAGIAALPPY